MSGCFCLRKARCVTVSTWADSLCLLVVAVVHAGGCNSRARTHTTALTACLHSPTLRASDAPRKPPPSGRERLIGGLPSLLIRLSSGAIPSGTWRVTSAAVPRNCARRKLPLPPSHRSYCAIRALLPSPPPPLSALRIPLRPRCRLSGKRRTHPLSVAAPCPEGRRKRIRHRRGSQPPSERRRRRREGQSLARCSHSISLPICRRRTGHEETTVCNRLLRSRERASPIQLCSARLVGPLLPRLEKMRHHCRIRSSLQRQQRQPVTQQQTQQ